MLWSLITVQSTIVPFRPTETSSTLTGKSETPFILIVLQDDPLTLDAVAVIAVAMHVVRALHSRCHDCLMDESSGSNRSAGRLLL